MKSIRKFAAVAVCISLAGCNATTLSALSKGSGGGRGLESGFINQSGVEFEFLDSGETYRTGETFLPPETIDCSDLTLSPSDYDEAISKGASIVRIQTPSVAKRIVANRDDGRTVEESVQIRPYYGGVLALCNVSSRAKGMDARSYNIRGLDEYFVKGSDGRISVVAAVVDVEPRSSGLFDAVIVSGNSSSSSRPTKQYSWMLWLTDRSTLFTDRARSHSADL